MASLAASILEPHRLKVSNQVSDLGRHKFLWYRSGTIRTKIVEAKREGTETRETLGGPKGVQKFNSMTSGRWAKNPPSASSANNGQRGNSMEEGRMEPNKRPKAHSVRVSRSPAASSDSRHSPANRD